MKKTRIAILILMLIAAACVLFGSTRISVGLLTFISPYRTAVFAGKDSSWFLATRMQLSLILADTLLVAVLIWIKNRWAAAVCAVACFLPSACLLVFRALDHKKMFAFDNLYDVLLFFLPLAAACLCFRLLQARQKEAAAPAPAAPAEAPKQEVKAASAQAAEPKTQPAAPAKPPKQDYGRLIDEYAHYDSLVFDDPKLQEMEDQIIAGGAEAQAAIADYLRRCGLGMAKPGWWQGAAGLTRMIRKIGGKDAETRLIALKSLSTRIWEYHTQVIDTAEKELLALKQESGGYGDDGRIPAEYAHAELLRLADVYPPEKRLEQAFAMKPGVEAWSKADQAFYYFIMGGATSILYPLNASNLAFYAAQVFCDPNPNSLGWQHLRKVEGELPANAENAAHMHEKYPLPQSMEECASYVHGLDTLFGGLST